jgi:hypothetical protein
VSRRAAWQPSTVEHRAVSLLEVLGSASKLADEMIK